MMHTVFYSWKAAAKLFFVNLNELELEEPSGYESQDTAYCNIRAYRTNYGTLSLKYLILGILNSPLGQNVGSFIIDMSCKKV